MFWKVSSPGVEREDLGLMVCSEQLQKTQAEAQKYNFADKKGKGKEKVRLFQASLSVHTF
jgi:hypothetical protein